MRHKVSRIIFFLVFLFIGCAARNKSYDVLDTWIRESGNRSIYSCIEVSEGGIEVSLGLKCKVRNGKTPLTLYCTEDGCEVITKWK